ncbi:MAG: hypothetical protein ACLPPV_08490 [Candidatus Korobacteraceae bacterium]
MNRPRAKLAAIRLVILTMICAAPAVPSQATTEIVVRSRYRIVLAADSRAIYGLNRNATECKLFEAQDVYATVSGLAHYGGSYRVTDTIRQGFARPGTFATHVSSTAAILRRRVENLLANLQASDPGQYRVLVQPSNYTSDLVQLAIAQMVQSQPMLGIIELRRSGTGNSLTTRTTICPGNCKPSTELFYLGYWERIKPYVATPSGPRSVGSAASIDRLIRLEIAAHPNEVSAPINILELTDSGARWLQNGGNCSLPGVGW